MAKSLIQRATDLGREANSNSKPRVPAWDKELIDMISGVDNREVTLLFKAWLNGWDEKVFLIGKAEATTFTFRKNAQ